MLSDEDKEIIKNGTFMQQMEALIEHFEDEAWIKEAHSFLKMIMKLTPSQKDILKLITTEPIRAIDIIEKSGNPYADKILLQLQKKCLIESLQMTISGHKRTWLGYKRQ